MAPRRSAAMWVLVLAASAGAGCDDDPGAFADGPEGGAGGGVDVGLVDGSAVDLPDGTASDGSPSDGTPSDGTASDGTPSDATLSDATPSDGGRPCDAVADPRWQPLDAIGTGPIQEVAVAALFGEMYVVGGFDDNRRIVPRLSVYDPENDAWRLGPAVPQAMHHANVAAAGGRLWVLGFLRDQLFAEDGRSFVYDPKTEQWSDAPSLPAGMHRGASGVGVVGDEIFIVGGLAAGQATSLVHAFNTADGTWRQLPDLPGPARDHMATAGVGGVLVVAGGRDGRIGAHVARVDVFDPAVGAWRRGADMPTSRGGVAAAGVDGRLVVLGGEGDVSRASGVFPQVEVYDVACDRWVSLPDMPEPRHGTGAAVIEGWLYMPGGAAVQAFGANATHARMRVQ